MTGNAWPTMEDFKKSVEEGVETEITQAMDSRIAYRSGTSSKEQLISLLKSYASWPEYRNEKTVDAMYDGFKQNKKMTMPIVLKMPNGSLRVMGGNTRMDVAFQLGINPRVIMVKVP